MNDPSRAGEGRVFTLEIERSRLQLADPAVGNDAWSRERVNSLYEAAEFFATRLRAVEEEWHEIRENWCKDVLLKEEAQAEARRLKEYARHKDLCAIVGGYSYGCTCGLTPPPVGPKEN